MPRHSRKCLRAANIMNQIVLFTLNFYGPQSQQLDIPYDTLLDIIFSKPHRKLKATDHHRPKQRFPEGYHVKSP